MVGNIPHLISVRNNILEMINTIKKYLYYKMCSKYDLTFFAKYRVISKSFAKMARNFQAW